MKLCNLLYYNLIYKYCALCMYTHTHICACLYILRVWLGSKQKDCLFILSWALWVTLCSLDGRGNCFFLGCRWKLQALQKLLGAVVRVERKDDKKQKTWSRRCFRKEEAYLYQRAGSKQTGREKKETFLKSSVDCVESDSAWTQQEIVGWEKKLGKKDTHLEIFV